MDSDPKDEEMLVQILQELSTQDAGSSAASILPRMFVHFPINLNGNTIAQPPPTLFRKMPTDHCFVSWLPLSFAALHFAFLLMNQIPESPSGYNYTVYPSFPPKAENKDVSTNYSEE